MYDVIVIGIGGMGSATLYHLGRAGMKGLGLEQFSIPHAFGSSHGSTRTIRLAYSEGHEYVPLVRAAYGYWRELEQVSGKRVLHVTGGLDIGPPGSWIVEGSRRSCIAHNLDYAELGGAEINRRFAGYRLPVSMRAIYQPEGGYVLSELAIQEYVRAAQELGTDVMEQVRVRGWSRRQGSTIDVDTTKGRFATKRLVVTAGAWVARLCPELRVLCRPERQVMLWTDPLEPEVFDPTRFPVFNMEAPSGRFYGYPNHDGEGFKIGKYHHLRQQVEDPEQVDRECHRKDESVLREGIEAYFPLASGPTRRMAACMFTNTPSGDFILDRYTEESDIFVAAGFSGHGFKFCSVVGKVMADFCQDRAPAWDIGRFKIH